MNELLLRHGCSHVFSLPAGLKELMSDISREVLREQPADIYQFIANYLSVLLMTREHGLLAMKILDDLCDCRPSLSEHFLQIGLPQETATSISEMVKSEIEAFEPITGREKLRESQILKNVLKVFLLDEVDTAKVCQIIRNAYKDFWYRKKLMEKHLSEEPEEPWERAAQFTLDIYKRTKPSMTELNLASTKIQAAYRAYYVRKHVLSSLKEKKQMTIDNDMPGPPLDIAASREIDLGAMVSLQPKQDEVQNLLDAHRRNVKYDPLHAITYRPDDPDTTPENYLDVDHEMDFRRHTITSQSSHQRGASEEPQTNQPERRSSELPETPEISQETLMHKIISFAEVPVEIDEEGFHQGKKKTGSSVVQSADEDIPEEIISTDYGATIEENEDIVEMLLETTAPAEAAREPTEQGSDVDDDDIMAAADADDEVDCSPKFTEALERTNASELRIR